MLGLDNPKAMVMTDETDEVNPIAARGSSPGPFLYRTVEGNFFSFKANKILDLHYLLLYNYDNDKYPFLAERLKVYKGILNPDLDFNWLFEQIRYPLSEIEEKRDMAQKLQSDFLKLSERIGNNLLEAYDVYEEMVWPSRRELFDTTLDYVAKDFQPIEALLFKQLVQSLNMQFKSPIPIFFVGEGTKFGGFTSEPSLTVINASQVKDLYLTETILHEAVHGVEHSNGSRSQSAYAMLSRALGQLKKTSAFKNAWHALIFWNSGELVRRYVDKRHIHYGEQFDVYDRAFKKERDLYSVYWNQYLDGMLTMGEAIGKITARL
jgi:hypothetical protein